MTLTIDLTEEEECRLRNEAAREGMKLHDWAKKQIVPPPVEPVIPTQAEKLKALFDSWAKEDAEHYAAMTPEEIAAEDAQSDEILRNIANGRIEFRTLNLNPSDYD